MNRKIKLVVLWGFVLLWVSMAGADEIHEAVRIGDLEKVKGLLKDNRELLNQPDRNGVAPLHHAIETGHTDIAKYLIEQGADVNFKDRQYQAAPLHYAAIHDNREILRILLKKGANIEERDIRQMTPLHSGCERGQVEAIKFLLDKGADIDARGEQGETTLMTACGSRNMAVVEVLVERGADINEYVMYQNAEYTALTVAAMYGFEDFVNYLIDKEVDLAESIRETTLEYAVQRDYIRLFDYVQEKGLNLADKKDEYSHLVNLATSSGSVRILESLIGYGYELEQTDMSGWTPIHHAASGGNMKMIDYLIGKGLDKNARTKRGETAYHLARFHRRLETADYLKQIGVESSEPKFPKLTGPYMGQRPPGDTPEMFMPGIVSGPYRAHGTIVFSPDGQEAYWGDMLGGQDAVFKMEIVQDQWTYPEPTNIPKDPSISVDGERIFFISQEPLKEGERGGKENYWFMDRTLSGWTEPKPLSDTVNAVNIHWQCSADKEDNLYFSEFEDHMYCSQYVNGKYQEPVNLIVKCKNKSITGRCPFISPAGDYLLFSHKGRMHISFKKKDGTWTDRINLGDKINTTTECGSPRVTPDGKYLFFQSTSGADRPWGIYWVSAKIIDTLKKKHLKNY